MTAASDNTFNLATPRRPSLADVGSASLVDDGQFPPDTSTMPTAAMLNIVQKLVAQLSQFVPVLRVGVTPSGGGGIVFQTMMTTNNVSITVTKNGTGDYSMTWPASSFPTSQNAPRAWITDTGQWEQADPQLISNGVRVKTRNSAGTLTDAVFIVEVY